MHSCQPSPGRPYLGRADGPNDTLAVHVGMKIHVRVSGPPAAASGERGDGLPATSARSGGEGNGGIQACSLGHIGFSSGKFIGSDNRMKLSRPIEIICCFRRHECKITKCREYAVILHAGVDRCEMTVSLYRPPFCPFPSHIGMRTEWSACTAVQRTGLEWTGKTHMGSDGDCEGRSRGKGREKERNCAWALRTTDNCSVVELSYRLASSLMDPSPHVLSEQSHASAHSPTGADRTMARGKCVRGRRFQ